MACQWGQRNANEALWRGMGAGEQVKREKWLWTATIAILLVSGFSVALITKGGGATARVSSQAACRFLTRGAGKGGGFSFDVSALGANPAIRAGAGAGLPESARLAEKRSGRRRTGHVAGRRSAACGPTHWMTTDSSAPPAVSHSDGCVVAGIRMPYDSSSAQLTGMERPSSLPGRPVSLRDRSARPIRLGSGGCATQIVAV